MEFAYYLIRKEFKSIDDVVSYCGLEAAGFEKRDLRDLDADQLGEAEVQGYYKPPTDSSTPQWAEFATQSFNVEFDDLQTQVASFIVFVTVDSRTFAIPFGQGHHRIKENVIEANFGQTTTLNKSLPQELRRVQKHQPGRRSRTTDITRYYSAPVLDIVGRFSSEVLKEVEGRVRHEGELKSIGGRDSLRWIESSDILHLLKVCREILAWFLDVKGRAERVSAVRRICAGARSKQVD